MRMEVALVGQHEKAKSNDISAQRCINLYPVQSYAGRSRAALIGTPGLLLWVTIGSGPCRGMIAIDGYLYVVSGASLYRVDIYGTSTLLGTVAGTGMVSMAWNGTQLMIVNGAQGYIWNQTAGTFAQITDPDFPGAEHVVFLDGYFIFNKPGTGSYMITAINDGTNIDALDIATAESNPDKIMAIGIAGEKLVLVGEYSTEIKYNSENSAFPFEKVRGTASQLGCAAKRSLVAVDDALIWLSRAVTGGRHVVMMRGYGVSPISTVAIDREIGAYAVVDDAIASVNSVDGNIFYDLTFPTENVTWSYNIRTKMWNQKSTQLVGRHRAQCSAYFAGYQMTGDYVNGNVYKLDANTYTDNGVDIIAVRDSQPLYSMGRRISVKGLFIDIEAGVGLNTGQGSDPKLMLAVSKDGGYTFDNEKHLSIGRIGEYAYLARRYNLGESREWVFRVSISDPVKRVILGAYADVDVGTN